MGEDGKRWGKMGELQFKKIVLNIVRITNIKENCGLSRKSLFYGMLSNLT